MTSLKLFHHNQRSRTSSSINSLNFFIYELIVLFTYISLFVESRSIPADDIVVRTGLGAIRGFEQHFDNTRLRVFYGVPYAKKPTGVRRFSKPVSF